MVFKNGLSSCFYHFFHVLFCVVPFRLFVVSDCLATTVQLAWNATTESDLAVYKLLIWAAPETYNSRINLGNLKSYSIIALNPGGIITS